MTGTRLTVLGWGCVGMLVLTAMAAFSTGNNLLYLLYSALGAALGVSWFAGRANLGGLDAEFELPSPIFRGDRFSLRLRLIRRGRWPSFAVRVDEAFAERIEPGQACAVAPRILFAHRGVNRLEGLRLESAFPLGLMFHRRELSEVTGTAFPKTRELRSPTEVQADARADGRPVLRKGSGDELFGIRDFDASDDARSINWKLTARTGRPLVNEYCVQSSSRVTVRVDAVGAGPRAEDKVEAAASAARFYIDAGCEVRLITPDGGVDYGKGLIQLDKILSALALLGEGKTARASAHAPLGGAFALHDSLGLRRLTYAGALLVYMALFLIDEISPRFLAGFLPIPLLGWFLHEKRLPRPGRWVWDFLAAAMLAFLIFIDWKASGVAIANIHLITFLVANRCLTDFPARELGQTFLILFLAFFLVSGLTISPIYFPFFLAYLAFAGFWLMTGLGLRLEGFRVWAPALGPLGLAVLLVSAVSFAITPRVDRFRRMNPFVAIGLDKLQAQSSAVSGFTENVSLGFFGELKKSTARVMRVKPLAPVGEVPGTLRLRGAAFDQFDGRRWAKSKVDFRYLAAGRPYWSSAGRAWAFRKAEQLFFPSAPPRIPARYEFTLFPINLSILFTVDGLWTVEGPSDAAYFDFTDTVHFAAPYTGGIGYRLYSDPAGLGFSASIVDYAAQIRPRYLQLPAAADPRIGELARKITAGAQTDEAKARAVEEYLRRAYRYSTFSDSGRTGLADFLFSTKKGNCEYFATAAAVLLRHAGVPTRLVSGFLSDEWNEYGKFFDVRQGQAHAWAEAYAGGRWITVEATPAAGLGTRADAVTERLRRYFSAIQANWYRHVIGYDSFVQRNTFFRLGAALSPARLQRLLILVLAAGAALALGSTAYSVWKAWPRRRRAPGFFEEAQARLEKAGLSRLPHLTPREYAAGVAARRPDFGAVAVLAELHYLDRYSPRGLSAEERVEVRRILESLPKR